MWKEVDTERRVAALAARQHGVLTTAQLNECNWTVDFAWPIQRVAVEADDLAYHRGDISFEDDHELELDLRLAGYAFQCVTGRQFDQSPDKLAHTLSRLLGLPSAAFPDG